MGTISSDDFYSGTVAVACGGTTTIIDYAEQAKGETLAQAVEAWRAKADPRALIDYGLDVSATDLREDILSEMEDVLRHGSTSFRCYLAYPERLRDDELLQVLVRAKDTAALVNVHCENGWLVDFMTRQLLAEAKTQPRWHPRSWPAAFESVVRCGTRLHLLQRGSPGNKLVRTTETALYNGQWELDIVETLPYSLARLVCASVGPSSREEPYGDRFLMRGTALGSRSLSPCRRLSSPCASKRHTSSAAPMLGAAARGLAGLNFSDERDGV